jgi:hypothetical protein
MTVATERRLFWQTPKMNSLTIAPWCLEHLESLKEFFVAPPQKWRFASLYRKLLAHRYYLLIRPDASVIEIGCGTGQLLNAFNCRLRYPLSVTRRITPVSWQA